MDDKRTAFALFLIIAFVMIYSEIAIAPLTRPATPPPSTQTAPQAEQAQFPQGISTTQNLAPTSSGQNLSQASAPIQPATLSHPTAAERQAEAYSVIETNDVIVKLSHLGGRVSNYELKHYHTKAGSDSLLDLVAANENGILPLGVYSGGLSDDHVAYQLASSNLSLDANGRYTLRDDQELRLSFSGKLSDGRSITKQLSFKPGSYAFKVDVQAQPPADGSPVWLEWSRYVSKLEAEDKSNPRQFTLLDQSSKLKHMTTASVLQPLTDPLPCLWASFDDRYFTAALIPVGSASGLNTRLGDEQSTYRVS